MTNSDSKFPLIGQEALKTVFRMHASGVAIITAMTKAGDPIGFTATSVTSLGSSPPLVTFNVARGSSSYEHLSEGTAVALHTLCAKNLELARQMAGPKELRFQGADFEIVDDVPVFQQASSVLLGRIRQRIEVESNAVVIMDALRSTEANDDARPLLYYRRGYLTATERLAENS